MKSAGCDDGDAFVADLRKDASVQESAVDIGNHRSCKCAQKGSNVSFDQVLRRHRRVPRTHQCNGPSTACHWQGA